MLSPNSETGGACRYALGLDAPVMSFQAFHSHLTNRNRTLVQATSTMGLEDFEKELAASKSKEDKRKRDSSRSRDRNHRSSKHQSTRNHRDERDRDGHHRDKRSRHHRETSEERSRRKRKDRERDDKHYDRSRRKHKDRRSRSPSSDDEDRMTRKRKSRHFDEDESSGDEVPQGRDYAPHDDELLDEQLEEAAGANVQRDDWMQAPSTMDVDYVQRKKREEKTTYVAASAEKQHALKIHKAELNHHLADLDKDEAMRIDDPAQREVDYTFGDSGSQWRMTKLKGIYRAAEETGRSVEDVAMEKYGNLRDFDDAREEETELDRRNMYGKDYVGKEKPSGELHEERRLKEGIHRPSREDHQTTRLRQGEALPDARPTTNTVTLSQTELNKLKAQMMKAKLKKSPDAARLEAEYNAAIAGSAGSTDRDVVVLNAMDNRMLAGGRQGEVISLENKRGVERGLVKENEDMSIEDMVRQERRTKGQNEGLILAEKIGKDVKFDVCVSRYHSML